MFSYLFPFLAGEEKVAGIEHNLVQLFFPSAKQNIYEINFSPLISINQTKIGIGRGQ